MAFTIADLCLNHYRGTAMNSQDDPNVDIEERVKASIASLKELVIIFAGLTITSAFGFFIQDHFKLIPEDIGMTSLKINLHLGKDSFILLLVVLCVMRFYHGNIMILDRYYLSPHVNIGNHRNITLDSTSILIMTFGLALLGCLIHNYVWFFFVYMLITMASIIWSSIIALDNVDRINSGTPDMLRDEYRTQMRWLYTNSAFFAIILIATIVALMSSRVPVVVGEAGAWIVNLELSDGMFWMLSGLVLLNSLWDLRVNRKEYFPRRVGRPASIAPERPNQQGAGR
jgi:hypothetical protein